MVDWKAIGKKLKIKFKVFIRWLLRRYKKEILRYVNEWVDQKLLEVNRVISEEARKRIKNEIVTKAIEDNVDIYTSAGAETVKQMISETLNKLEGE